MPHSHHENNSIRMRLSVVFSCTVVLCALLNLYNSSQRLGLLATTDSDTGDSGGDSGVKDTWARPHRTPEWEVPQVVPNDDDDDPDTVPTRVPTGSACNGYDGIYHVAMGDKGGAAGTIFFQFVIGQLLYAERNNLKPWVFLNNVSYVVYDPAIHAVAVGDTGVQLTALTGRNATYIQRPGGHARDWRPGPLDLDQPVTSTDLHFDGTGVWEHYFEPVSDFVPGDVSCQSKLYTTLDLYLITPGIHGFSDWAPKCWRYHYLPDYVSKPHVPLAEWLEPQRKIGHETAKKYIRFRPYLKEAAARANPDCSSSGKKNSSCLGLHIRHSDKSAGRRVLETDEFLPFAQAFVDAGGQHIYLATDSSQVLKHVRAHWPAAVRDRIRTIGDNIVRSSDDKAVFDLGSHHRTNQEVLIEILALSHCQFLVHGLSAVSESVIWINLGLHVQSVNLEDPDHLNEADFGSMVQLVLRGESQDRLPRPVRTDEWWKTAETSTSVAPTQPSNVACTGYDGILHIAAVGNDASAGAAFFTSVLNQLIYADMYNLKPWIHLSSNSSELVFDAVAHGDGAKIPFAVTTGTAMVVDSVVATADKGKTVTYPGKPLQVSREPTATVGHSEDYYTGSGIWNSYFEPVSDLFPGDKSCAGKPVVVLSRRNVSSILMYSPWSVKPWRHDPMPPTVWNPEKIRLKEWYEPMRRRASEIVDKYYHFKPQIVKRAGEVNPVSAGQTCLAVHLRNNDKNGRYRKKVTADKFEAYIDAFERAGGETVYIATDSNRVLQYIDKNYPERLTKLIRTQGKAVVRADKAIRGKKEFPTHFLDGHHRVNNEALVDILAMSKCDLLLHGFSTVSEAAIYLNPTLHNHSVNLEDPNRLTADDFEALARRVVAATRSAVS